MTYTYKLARRLAISRKLGMSTAFALLAACAGDTTAPEVPANPGAPSDPSLPTPLGFRVLPSAITVEVEQSFRFRVDLRGARPGYRLPAMRWEATGGTITPDGTFSARRPGTYRVIGRSRIHRPDTSLVVGWAEGSLSQEMIERWAANGSQRLILRFNPVRHGAVLEV